MKYTTENMRRGWLREKSQKTLKDSLDSQRIISVDFAPSE